MQVRSTILFWLLIFSALQAVAKHTDLSQWNGKGIVSLVKGWHFIPSEFVYHNFGQHHAIQVESGAPWNELRTKNVTMSGRGHGTYFIELQIPKNIDQLELDFGTISSSFALYVNGKPIKQVGNPYGDKKYQQANYDTRIIKIPIDTSAAVVVLHVANDQYNKGGLWQTVYLSSDQKLTMKRRYIISGLLILFGGVLIIGIYHFGIYLLRNSERAFLYFFLWTSLASMRLLFSGRYYPILDFIDIPFDMIVRIEYFTFYAAIPLFLKFIHEVFPLYVNKKLVHSFLIIGSAFSISVWLLPLHTVTASLIIYQVLTTLGIAYVMRVLYRVFKYRETGAFLFGLGVIVLSIVVIHDILTANNLFSSGYWFSAGFGIFVCFQSYLLASRFIKTFNKAEVLGRELNYLNVHLEKIVAERTEKLKSTNQELQKRNKEIENQSSTLKSLNKELEKLSIVASETDNAILIINPNGYIEWVNHGFTRLYGYNLKEMHKRFGENLKRAGQNKKIDEIFAQVLKTRKSYNYESIVESKSGEKISVHTTLTPIFNDDAQLIYLVAIDSDIRKIKQIQNELYKANSAKNKLFTIIAHDLRSPFNSLLGLTDLIMERFQNLTPDELFSLIKDLNETALKTYHLLQNLLDWSRAQRDKIVITPEQHNLAELIYETTTLFETALLQKNIQLNLNIEPHITIFADKPSVDTVIRNLMSNAVKFTPRQGVISITANQNQKHTSITITDNGVGMSAKQIETLLTKEDENTTDGTENEKGTGLGLMLVKYFIEKNKGHIDIESNEGNGTSISIHLPANNNSNNDGS